MDVCLQKCKVQLYGVVCHYEQSRNRETDHCSDFTPSLMTYNGHLSQHRWCPTLSEVALLSLPRTWSHIPIDLHISPFLMRENISLYLPLPSSLERIGTVWLFKTVSSQFGRLCFFRTCVPRVGRGSERGNVGQTNSTTGHCLYFRKGAGVRLHAWGGNPKFGVTAFSPSWKPEFSPPHLILGTGIIFVQHSFFLKISGEAERKEEVGITFSRKVSISFKLNLLIHNWSRKELQSLEAQRITWGARATSWFASYE